MRQTGRGVCSFCEEWRDVVHSVVEYRPAAGTDLLKASICEQCAKLAMTLMTQWRETK